MLTVFQLWDLFIRLRDKCGPSHDLGCIVREGIAELEPLLREYFTTEIRDRVSDPHLPKTREAFDPDGIATSRLYVIFDRLQACGEGDYLCMAGLEIPEIDTALRDTLTQAIPVITGEAEDGTKFDERWITTLRLAAIHDAIKEHTADELATWEGLADFPEVEGVIRQRWIEKCFRTVRDALQTDPAADISESTQAYRAAIEAAFDAQFTKVNNESYDWVLASIHFARLGLTATAKAFDDWVVSRLAELPEGDQRRERRGNRFRLFRNIMGSMTFKNVNEVQPNVAYSGMDTILIYRRSKSRQGVMTPNNFIHELGHSLSRYSGFGYPGVGSTEQALADDQMPNNRVGMGQPPYTSEEMADLFYEHASVTDEDPKDGVVDNFDTGALGNKPPTDFDPSGYLLYDLFETNYTLWAGIYNTFINTNARIDVFVHNANFTTNATLDRLRSETAADAFLNWVRVKFDFSSDGTKWKEFFEKYIGMFLRNAAIYQKGMVPYYEGLGIISSIGTGTPGAARSLRLTPSTTENNGLQYETLAPSPQPIPIYGWYQPPESLPDNSKYWLLVSTADTTTADGKMVHGKLAWVAAAGITHDAAELEDSAASATSDFLQLVSPARPFELSDLDLILGE